LSDIFLDTELQPHDYARIAAALSHSSYPVSALKAIFEEEVAPAFVFNMQDVPGEWTSWNQDEVREIMLRSDRQLPPMRWFKRRQYERFVQDEWKRISALL
jgi:hypothetical protein